MAITRLTPESQIRQQIDEQVERYREAVIYNLCYVGEQVLNRARTTNSYKDQTGNLRSSLGYIVIVDGEVVTVGGFVASDKGTDKVTGQKEGKAYAEQLVERFPKGIVLIVVAGMSYASYVSAKGYDVLDSAQLLADKLVPEILEQLASV